MNLRIAAVLLVVATGCKPKFSGTYEGDEDVTVHLTSTSAAGAISANDISDRNLGAKVVVTQSGNTVAVDYRSCHFEAKQDTPSQASVEGFECPLAGHPGVTFKVTTGFLSLEAKQLSWSFMGTAEQKGGGSGSFESSFTGDRHPD